MAAVAVRKPTTMASVVPVLCLFLGSSYLCLRFTKKRRMEIIAIERKAFEQLLQEMQLLTARVETLARKCEDRKRRKWIDGDEVCELLRLSPRSLQELRSKHRIGYAQIGRKFYYRPEEVELVLRQLGKYINNK